MKIKKIGDRNIIFKYNLPEWDLNLHLILGNNYNYIIDTGLGSESVVPIKEYLDKNLKPIIIVNTHYHWDHIWGNDYFKNHIIISHTLCRELIIEKWQEMMDRNKAYIKGNVEMCLPNLLFDESLYFPDDKIRIFHTPGHTLDCISVFDEKDKILNAGDNVGDAIDKPVPSLKTKKDVYLNSINKYKELDVNFCVSGHNEIFRKEIFNTIKDLVSS